MFYAASFTGCAAEVDEVTGQREPLEACPAAEGQSPIDLPAAPAVGADLADVIPVYSDTHVAMTNTGGTIQYDYEPGSSLLVGTEQFELVQFHFHSQSEHTVAGARSPMELHLVHRNAAGQLLVLGVLIDASTHNAVLDAADWDDMPEELQAHYENVADRFSAMALIPGGRTYRYTGSLTAPPCTSGVRWIVFERHLALDGPQIGVFTHLYARNFRETQPLELREVQFGE